MLSGSFGGDDVEVTLSYAQSRSAVEFLLRDSRYGPAKFARTVAALRDGVEQEEALQRGLGATTDAIDRQWRESLPYKVAAPGPAPGRRSAGSQDAHSAWPQLWPLVLVSLALLGGFFLAGGAITAVFLRGRREKR